MKKLVIKLLDRASKDNKSIIISSVTLSALIVCIAFMLYIGYYVWNIPTNARLVSPGGTYHLSEDIDVEDTNLYKVGVYVTYPKNRWDIIEFMWSTKTFISSYIAYSLDHTEGKPMEVLQIESVKNSLEAELEKYTTLETYLMNEYGEQRTDELFNHLKIFEETIGDSDALALTLLLKQIAENEVVTSSDKKVVITGSMDESGNAIRVGEVPMKAITADKEDADYFIVPEEQYEEAVNAKEANNLSLEIMPVDTVDEAYELLQTIE